VYLTDIDPPYLRRVPALTTFATLGRSAGESGFDVARASGHSRSTLVDQAYARLLQPGMAGVAGRVTAKALGEQPRAPPDGPKTAGCFAEPLEEAAPQASEARSTG